MSNRWYTTNDVLRDLSEVNGRISEFDETYTAVGERPPPPRPVEDEDISFYSGIADKGLDEMAQPDLNGITGMLRMVDEFYDNKDERIENPAETTAIISKLNPNSQEFVPKGKKSDVLVDNKENLNTVNAVVDMANVSEVNTEIDNPDDCDMKDMNMDKRIDVEKLKPEQISVMRKKLKSKIKDASNSDCLKVKRERVLAIATLMKLHSVPSQSDEKPKLMTPQDFETVPARSKATETPNSNEHLIEDNVQPETSSPNLGSDLTVPDSEIKESVEKVKNWFGSIENPVPEPPPFKINSPESPQVGKNKAKNKSPASIERGSPAKSQNSVNFAVKSEENKPALYMGPLMFAKKTSNGSKSPASVADNKQKVKSDNKYKPPPSFIPSQYATELTNKYKERSKAKERLEKDIWTKLEDDLKAKDEEILKKRQQQNASDQSDRQE